MQSTLEWRLENDRPIPPGEALHRAFEALPEGMSSRRGSGDSRRSGGSPRLGRPAIPSDGGDEAGDHIEEAVGLLEIDEMPARQE